MYCCQNCSSNRLPSAFAFHICSFWHITSFKKTKFSLLTFFQRHHFHHLHVPEHSADGIWQKKVFIQKYHFICKKCWSGLEGRNRTQSGQTTLSKILNLWNHPPTPCIRKWRLHKMWLLVVLQIKLKINGEKLGLQESVADPPPTQTPNILIKMIKSNEEFNQMRAL